MVSNSHKVQNPTTFHPNITEVLLHNAARPVHSALGLPPPLPLLFLEAPEAPCDPPKAAEWPTEGPARGAGTATSFSRRQDTLHSQIPEAFESPSGPSPQQGCLPPTRPWGPGSQTWFRVKGTGPSEGALPLSYVPRSFLKFSFCDRMSLSCGVSGEVAEAGGGGRCSSLRGAPGA